eukprot:6213271-Pleurochrysis_carterae.AAC.6
MLSPCTHAHSRVHATHGLHTYAQEPDKSVALSAGAWRPLGIVHALVASCFTQEACVLQAAAEVMYE